MRHTSRRYDAEQVRRLSDTTIVYYDRFARAFWEGTRHHDVSQNYAAFLDAIEGDPPYSILDLGCGPGRDLSHFRSLGHEAMGLDGSQQFVEMARALSQCEVLHQDFLAMQLPESRFDGVFANASLFHVPSQELPRVLLELFKTLKPRGVLFCSNPRGNNEEGSTTIATPASSISTAGAITSPRPPAGQGRQVIRRSRAPPGSISAAPSGYQLQPPIVLPAMIFEGPLVGAVVMKLGERSLQVSSQPPFIDRGKSPRPTPSVILLAELVFLNQGGGGSLTAFTQVTLKHRGFVPQSPDADVPRRKAGLKGRGAGPIANQGLGPELVAIADQRRNIDGAA